MAHRTLLHQHVLHINIYEIKNALHKSRNSASYQIRLLLQCVSLVPRPHPLTFLAGRRAGWQVCSFTVEEQWMVY